MDTTQLKNGAEEGRRIVYAMTRILDKLMADYPVALYELIALCRDPEHELFGNASEVLRGWNLINDVRQVHDSIRNIVLSATEGEGFDLHLVSPVAT